MRDTFVVRTPENVGFEFELASVGMRAAAWGIDVVVMGSLILALAFTVSLVATVSEGLAFALISIATFGVQWGYGALLEWRFSGRTIGKRLVGLRVVDERGLRLDFSQAAIRNLVRVVDLLPGLYLLGGVCALVDARARRLGDIAAGTVVVRERAAIPPTVFLPESERHNTFLGDPSVISAAARLSARERDAMIALGLRRERLPLSVRAELFERVAAHLEARAGVPRPAFFTPEKYVLSMTAAMLSAGTVDKERGSLPPPRKLG